MDGTTLITVTEAHCDELGHLNHVEAVRYLERARGQWYRDRGLHEGDGERFGSVVVNIDYDYRAECFLGETLKVTTRPVSMGTKSFTLAHEIVKPDGRIAIDGRCTSVIMDLAGRAIVPVPECIAAMLAQSSRPSSNRPPGLGGDHDAGAGDAAQQGPGRQPVPDAPRLPDDDTLVIHFAHVAYRLAERFALRRTGIEHFQTWRPEDTLARASEGHVLVVSGFWSDAMLEHAANVRFIQVCAAGYDQFDLDALRARGVWLANGSGVNRNAVSDHAMALLLALVRHVHTGRDRQREHVWRGMISDLGRREEELAGKTMLVCGLGAIGARVARLARAFGMKVVGIKRDTANHDGSADEVRPPDRFLESLAEADAVVLTCPLTLQTENLIDATALARMKPGAYLVNVARGRCVNEPDLAAALARDAIAGAGIDTTWEEPLAPDSALWDLENVLITPHTAGETRRYEDNVVDVLIENVRRLQRGKDVLVNRIV